MLKNNNITKWLFSAICALLISCSSSRYAVELTAIDVSDTSINKNINVSSSALLNELNKAYAKNRYPSFNKIKGLNKSGKSSIIDMWKITPFHCIEPKIIERAYKTSNGWQVRNIPVILKNIPEGNSCKEIVINFDSVGVIEDIYFALSIIDYKTIIDSEESEVTDLLHRQAILDFVKNLQTAYNCKDIDLLAKVYSDDDLIVTGKVVKQIKSTNNISENCSFSKEHIKYQALNKKEYIKKLLSIFKNNDKINVVLDRIDVARHPKYNDIYGLTFKQSWNTTNYSDTGYWFFLIYFKDGENMQISMRTWQPENLNGKQLSED